MFGCIEVPIGVVWHGKGGVCRSFWRLRYGFPGFLHFKFWRCGLSVCLLIVIMNWAIYQQICNRRVSVYHGMSLRFQR